MMLLAVFYIKEGHPQLGAASLPLRRTARPLPLPTLKLTRRPIQTLVFNPKSIISLHR